jgi:hypothetical protein
MADFNIDKVVCLNLKIMDLKQIFSISETYSWDFEVLLNDKNTGSNKLYVESDTGEVIGMEEQLMCKYTNKLHDPRFMVFSKFSPVTKKIYDRLKNMQPVKVPKFPKNERALNSYLYYLEQGYDIRMVSLDRKIEYLKNNPVNEVPEVDLNSALAIAVKEEDYLKAAALHEEIKKLEKPINKIKLEELNNLLAIAIQAEDYLKAAEIIEKIKNSLI